MTDRAPLGAGLAGSPTVTGGQMHPSPELLNSFVLAFIGDALFDLHIRLGLVGGGFTSAHGLHEAAVTYVRADAQAAALQAIESHLTEEEQGIVRRARNARPGHLPRNADPAAYHQATAFEALLGFLYLAGRGERLTELLRAAGLVGE